MKAVTDHSLLRLAALAAAPIGAVGSLVFMFRVGHRNPSAILMGIFTLWVLAPFIAMAWTPRCLKHRPSLAQVTFQVLTLVLTLGSLLVYGEVAFGAPRPQPAFMFLVVPFASLLLIGVALLIATFASRASRNEPNA